MGRPAKPWYRASTDAWFVELNGKQVRLANGKSGKVEAHRQLARLMVNGSLGGSQVDTRMTVPELVELFLKDQKERLELITFGGYQKYQVSFAHAQWEAVAETIRPHHVNAWLDSKPKWGPTTRFNAATAVKRLFSWAKREGRIELNPIADLQRPTPRSRDSEIDTEQARKILEHVKDSKFHDLMLALWLTGCRPGELCRAEAIDLSVSQSTIQVIDKIRWKTGRKYRTIQLVPAALELFSRLAIENPTGSMFRNKLGNPWTRNAMACRFRQLRKAGIVQKGQVPYSIRHGYVTDAFVSGVDLPTLLPLLGHQTSDMALKTYSKLHNRTGHLATAAAKIRPEITSQVAVEQIQTPASSVLSESVELEVEDQQPRSSERPSPRKKPSKPRQPGR